MKKRIKYIVVILLLLSIFPGILFYEECRLPALYSESYYAELPELYEHLSNCTGNKVVLIGGSNIAFGVDSELLETCLSDKGYDYTVCPFGLYAAVGTSAMLDLSLDTLQKGDIVILSFEPMQDSMSTYFGATAFLKCAESNWNLLTKLDKTRLGACIGNYLGFVQERKAIVASANYPTAEGVYAKSSFNESGNMIYDRAGNMMTIGFDISSPIDLEHLTIPSDFAKQVTEYCEAAVKKGATVYYSFAPMNKSAVTNASAEVMEAYFNLCNEAFPCQIISDPNRYLLDSGWFYDSNFHLNSAGAGRRTIQLAEDLLAALGCYERLDIPLPVMPEALRDEVMENNAFADENVPANTVGIPTSEGTVLCGDFLLTAIGDNAGYTVTGTGKSGSLASSLTLPAYCNGLPVVSIDSAALSGCYVLEELRVPETISALPDGLFADCTSLQRLILEHTGSPCKITAHSLEGASQIKIFVPAESYSMYRDGYGCEANLWTPYLSQIYTY